MSEQIKRKELEVLKLINQNRNWEEILSSSPYNIIIKKKYPFYLLKYNQLESDMTNEIVQECRGLIIKRELFSLTSNPPIQQYKIASMRFTKFFNYGQEEAAKLEFPCEASEKIDGSLIGVWYDKETGWHISTSGNVDAIDSPIDVGDYQSYRGLFDSVWEDEFFDRLNKDCTYMFELVSPYTRIIVPYKETKLYLLAIRNNITLEEFNRSYLSIIAEQLFGDKITVPKSYICNNIKEMQKAVNKLTEDDENYEGFVLCDKNFNRVKLKSPFYTELFFVKGEGIFTNKKILNLILDEQDDDILAYFPEYKEQFDRVRRGLSKMIQNMKNDIRTTEKWKELNKKDFAFNIKDFKYKDFLFKVYDYQIWDKTEEEYAQFLQSYIDKLYELNPPALHRFVESEINEVNNNE